ncbi:MAG: XRE family transcriptional regulator [Rheinheimera sp.]|uniref:helix-turn-helix transcriptional regulator n=1 Tax=Arsukibacterium sp. UBA3155 TaxID=1946058 RepID=UPI000C8EF100|nr:helix-turn-helix transcriptional regulator [Arsukibacterium sp. UBA3155]MAD75132.1 XRE family transcriptional regulator [Rheinheimera sp.]|tara:strand:+ start:49835 stop:50557 length:723 start_codon:yes stop_codon:yes gene_type:complete
MNETMAGRIRKRRKELKLTQDKVADYCGINRVSVSNWETIGKNGTSPKGANLIALAELLRVTPEWILTGEVKPENSSVSESLPSYAVGSFDLWDSKTPLNDDEVELPFYKEIELSAGTGSAVQLQDSGFKLRFAKSTLRRYNIQPDLAACVTVNGNSMEPVLPDQATVGIDTGNTKIKDGDMYAIDHDGLLKVKRLYRLPGNGIRIRSFNTDEYPDEDYQTEQASAIKVLGRVFWYSVLR